MAQRDNVTLCPHKMSHYVHAAGIAINATGKTILHSMKLIRKAFAVKTNPKTT